MYDDTNKGVLFKNNEKDNEKKPDYTGKINVDGKELRLAAWIRTSSKDPNNKFLSLAVSEPQPQQQSDYGL